MKISLITHISIRVFLCFVLMIVGSYFADMFHDFFGDSYCSGSGDYYIGKGDKCSSNMLFHSPTWHWGLRHVLFFVMCSLLLILQAVSIGRMIDK